MRFGSQGNKGPLLTQGRLGRLVRACGDSRFRVFHSFTSLLGGFRSPVIGSFVVIRGVNGNGVCSTHLSGNPVRSVGHGMGSLGQLNENFHGFRRFHGEFLFTAERAPILGKVASCGPMACCRGSSF